MNILGVGGWELAVILVIMLIVAGPKRMMQWAYVLGQYTAKLRRMWAETMTVVQKELNESGVDIELPKEIPTRGTLNQEVTKALSPLTRPFQEALQEGDISESLPRNLLGAKTGNGAATSGTAASGAPTSGAATGSKPAAKPAPPKPQSAPPKPATNGQTGGAFGTWSGSAPRPPADDAASDLGTWSGNGNGSDKS